jgi:hypothetical protein
MQNYEIISTSLSLPQTFSAIGQTYSKLKTTVTYTGTLLVSKKKRARNNPNFLLQNFQKNLDILV